MKQILKNNVDTAPSSLLTHTPLYPTATNCQLVISSLPTHLPSKWLLTILGFLRIPQTELLLLPISQSVALVSQWHSPSLTPCLLHFHQPLSAPSRLLPHHAHPSEPPADFLFYPQIISTYLSSSISVVPTPDRVLHPLPSRMTYSLPAEISSTLLRGNPLFQTKAKWLF